MHIGDVVYMKGAYDDKLLEKYFTNPTVYGILNTPTVKNCHCCTYDSDYTEDRLFADAEKNIQMSLGTEHQRDTDPNSP